MSDYDFTLDRPAKTALAIFVIALIVIGFVLGRCSARYTVKVDVQTVEAK